MTIEEQIAGVETEIADRQRILRAPLELARLKARQRDLELKAERAAELAHARAVDPEYDRKLADARDAARVAQEDVDRHELARRRRKRTEPVPQEAFDRTLLAGERIGSIGGRLAQPLGVFLPRETPAHLAAAAVLNAARNRVRRLERWPHERAIAEMQGSGEPTAERIANAPKVPFFKVRGFAPRRGDAT